MGKPKEEDLQKLAEASWDPMPSTAVIRIHHPGGTEDVEIELTFDPDNEGPEKTIADSVAIGMLYDRLAEGDSETQG